MYPMHAQEVPMLVYYSATFMTVTSNKSTESCRLQRDHTPEKQRPSPILKLWSGFCSACEEWQLVGMGARGPKRVQLARWRIECKTWMLWVLGRAIKQIKTTFKPRRTFGMLQHHVRTAPLPPPPSPCRTRRSFIHPTKGSNSSLSGFRSLRWRLCRFVCPHHIAAGKVCWNSPATARCLPQF